MSTAYRIGAWAAFAVSLLDLIFAIVISVYSMSLLFYGLSGEALLSAPIDQQTAVCLSTAAMKIATVKP